LVVRIVRSERINGQPRLKLVAYIGSIRRDAIDLQGAHRRFWDRAAERLERFTPEIRAKFEQSIEAQIPRPPAEAAASRAAGILEAARDAARAKLAAFRAARVNEYTSAAGGTGTAGTGRDNGAGRRGSLQGTANLLDAARMSGYDIE